MCTMFGVDSSSRFPFRAWTNRQADATERHTHAGGYTAGVGNNNNNRTLELVEVITLFVGIMKFR